MPFSGRAPHFISPVSLLIGCRTLLYIFNFEILSLITIRSSLWIHRLLLHLLRHYRILQVWTIWSNLHILWYYSLSLPNLALNHHRLAMLVSPDPHLHRRHCPPHTRRHHWFPAQTSRVQLRPVVSGWRWGWHRSWQFCHCHCRHHHYHLASWNAGRHLYNFVCRWSVLSISGSSSATSEVK